jgi:hypothetical protein
MEHLSGSNQLKVPNQTRVAFNEGKLVISYPNGKKTLTGEHAEISKYIIEESDGSTELSEIVETMDGLKAAVAEVLYEAGIVYPKKLLEPLSLDNCQESVSESILLSLENSERQMFAADVTDTTVRIRGDDSIVADLHSALNPIGWDIDIGEEKKPDVIVYIETDGVQKETRKAVNREWQKTDSVLIRAALDGRSVEIGPILTQAAQSCLECLTTREQINSTVPQLDFQSLAEGQTYEMRFIDHLVFQLLLQTVTRTIPASLTGRIKTINMATLDYSQSYLLGIPGCESCGARY